MWSPSSNDSTSTSADTSGNRGTGKRTWLVFRKLKLKRDRLDASRARSTCSLSGAANCRSVSSSRRPFAAGSPASADATHSIASKSARIASAVPGWRTLTATIWPAWQPVTAAPRALSVARWIWPIDPLATGAVSNVSNTSDSGIPNARSRIVFVCRNACAGACVCRCASDAHMSGGNRSCRVAAHWPHLMKNAPPVSNVRRSRYIHAGRPTSHSSAAGASSSTGANTSSSHASRTALRTDAAHSASTARARSGSSSRPSAPAAPPPASPSAFTPPPPPEYVSKPRALASQLERIASASANAIVRGR
mmetsp:Transcript_34328/g.101984  ORF Transcript_34328/g.101984 Transcript_34328/m.101984 type:complete len:307 (+) Transcript_34328:802-1722(+)